jgi:hypothetical protein
MHHRCPPADGRFGSLIFVQKSLCNLDFVQMKTEVIVKNQRTLLSVIQDSDWRSAKRMERKITDFLTLPTAVGERTDEILIPYRTALLWWGRSLTTPVRLKMHIPHCIELMRLQPDHIRIILVRTLSACFKNVTRWRSERHTNCLRRCLVKVEFWI